MNQRNLVLHSLDTPAWAISPHIHTIVPSLFDRTESPLNHSVFLHTPDDDELEVSVHLPQEAESALIILHGLEGSADRYYVSKLAVAAKEQNMAVFGLNFRSCGSRMNKKRRFYHSGDTGDLKVLIEYLQESYSELKLFLAGFSLGGNVTQCYLAEFPENPIQRAATISAPFDLKVCSMAMQRGFNKVYEIRFLRKLLRKLEEKRSVFPDMPRFSGKTLYDFDDQVTAPLHGFKSADDYYERCSALSVIDRVETPLLVVHAEGDPICPFDVIPTEELENHSYISTFFTREGGHVGFVTYPPDVIQKSVINFLTEK